MPTPLTSQLFLPIVFLALQEVVAALIDETSCSVAFFLQYLIKNINYCLFLVIYNTVAQVKMLN